MRVGACVLFLHGYCYQSFGWRSFRPLGRLQHVVTMLESYQVDEIAIVRPVRIGDDKSAFEADLRILRQLKTMTPISFGGGIRCHEDLGQLRDLPIERLILSSAAINTDERLLSAAARLFGRQAIQAMLPVSIQDGCLTVFNSERNEWKSLDAVLLDFCISHANEVILYDAVNEGSRDGFDWSLVAAAEIDPVRVILSGGIGEAVAHRAAKANIAAVLVENRLLHHEYSMGRYRHG